MPQICHGSKGYSDSVNAKMCPVCKSCTENLHHFLKDCPLYSKLRNDICPDLISLSIEEIVKANLMANVIGKYVFLALKMRSRAIETLSDDE